jgi:hydroxyacylglutathione hydrolase
MATPLEAVKWIQGAPDCRLSTDPLIQVHPFDDDTFVLRVSKCYSFEGNFIYLLFGDARAVVFDTGSPPRPPNPHNQVDLPIRRTVHGIIDGWLRKRGRTASTSSRPRHRCSGLPLTLRVFDHARDAADM